MEKQLKPRDISIVAEHLARVKPGGAKFAIHLWLLDPTDEADHTGFYAGEIAAPGGQGQPWFFPNLNEMFYVDGKYCVATARFQVHVAGVTRVLLFCYELKHGGSVDLPAAGRAVI